MLGQYSFAQLQSLVSDMYDGQRVDIRPFGYVFDFNDIASGGNQGVSTAKIVGNSDFLVCSIGYGARDGAGGYLETLLQIEDAGSQERFFNQATPVNQVATGYLGNGQSFYRGLAYPRRVLGNSLLTATLTSGPTANLDNPQIYLDGVSVYVYGN